MPGTAGPRHGLVWGYVPGENDWGVSGFNPNFAKLEALLHLTVISITATPPGSPANGACYIVGASATGAWAGHDNHVAVWYTTGTPAWLYIVPAPGVRAFNIATTSYWRWTGTAWVAEASSSVVGPGSAVDSDVALFDGTTGALIKDSGKTLPAGFIVGTSDLQVLTNKGISGLDNTIVIRLNADVAGNLPVGNLNAGVGAGPTTYWRGDGTWAEVPVPTPPTPVPPKYVIGCFVPGVLLASQVLLLHQMSGGITIPADFGSYLGYATRARGQVAATASLTIDVQRATAAAPGVFTSVGTIAVAAGSLSATFSTSGVAVVYAAGDTLALVGPATPDTTFASFSATLVGRET